MILSCSEEKKIQIKLFYSLSFSSLLHFAILGLLSPYIAIYFKQEGLPFGILFLIFFANNLGNIAQPLWGGLSDKYDRRKIFIVVASIMWTLSTIIFYVTPEFLIFVIFFGIASFFGSSVQPVARSMIAFMSLEGEETEYQSKFGVLLATSFTLSAWIAGIIVDFFDFNMIFFIIIILAVLSLFLSLLTIPEYKMKEINNLSKNSNYCNQSINKIINSNSHANSNAKFTQKLKELLKNRLFMTILIFSFFGGFSFYFFFSFISIFFKDRGINLSIFSWTFISSFIFLMLVNYIGEALMKRKNKNKWLNKQDSSKIKDFEKSMQKNRLSKKLKMIFIFWSIIGFFTLCFLISFLPNMILIILLVYSLPIVPFFFTSMLALTTSVVKMDQKALAIGLQGVFVFGGRSLTAYIGSIFLDLGGFSLAAFINLFLMIVLLVIGIYNFKKLNLI